MSHISTQELDLKAKKEIINSFDMVLGKCNQNEVNEFLFSLLSTTERLMLAKRLAVVVLLKENVGLVDASKALSVTYETAQRMELLSIKKPKGWGIAMEKINNDLKNKEIKKMLMKLAKYSVKAAGGRVSV